MVETASLHCTQAVGLEFAVQPDCVKGQTVYGTVYGDRVLYPVPGFLSCDTWPPLPKKHQNGLINQSIMLLHNGFQVSNYHDYRKSLIQACKIEPLHET